MQTLKMNIVAFDEQTHSLLVSFASDATASANPSDYQPVAFQPAVMWPDAKDASEIRRCIAIAGVAIAQQQVLKEAAAADAAGTAALQAMAGQSWEYSAAYLADPEPESTPLLVI
jgi:hypothetical protein